MEDDPSLEPDRLEKKFSQMQVEEKPVGIELNDNTSKETIRSSGINCSYFEIFKAMSSDGGDKSSVPDYSVGSRLEKPLLADGAASLLPVSNGMDELSEDLNSGESKQTFPVNHLDDTSDIHNSCKFPAVPDNPGFPNKSSCSYESSCSIDSQIDIIRDRTMRLELRHKSSRQKSVRFLNNAPEKQPTRDAFHGRSKSSDGENQISKCSRRCIKARRALYPCCVHSNKKVKDATESCHHRSEKLISGELDVLRTIHEKLKKVQATLRRQPVNIDKVARAEETLSYLDTALKKLKENQHLEQNSHQALQYAKSNYFLAVSDLHAELAREACSLKGTVIKEVRGRKKLKYSMSFYDSDQANEQEESGSILLQKNIPDQSYYPVRSSNSAFQSIKGTKSTLTTCTRDSKKQSKLDALSASLVCQVTALKEKNKVQQSLRKLFLKEKGLHNSSEDSMHVCSDGSSNGAGSLEEPMEVQYGLQAATESADRRSHGEDEILKVSRNGSTEDKSVLKNEGNCQVPPSIQERNQGPVKAVSGGDEEGGEGKESASDESVSLLDVSRISNMSSIIGLSKSDDSDEANHAHSECDKNNTKSSDGSMASDEASESLISCNGTDSQKRNRNFKEVLSDTSMSKQEYLTNSESAVHFETCDSEIIPPTPLTLPITFNCTNTAKTSKHANSKSYIPSKRQPTLVKFKSLTSRAAASTSNKENLNSLQQGTPASISNPVSQDGLLRDSTTYNAQSALEPCPTMINGQGKSTFHNMGQLRLGQRDGMAENADSFTALEGASSARLSTQQVFNGMRNPSNLPPVDMNPSVGQVRGNNPKKNSRKASKTPCNKKPAKRSKIQPCLPACYTNLDEASIRSVKDINYCFSRDLMLPSLKELVSSGKISPGCQVLSVWTPFGMAFGSLDRQGNVIDRNGVVYHTIVDWCNAFPNFQHNNVSASLKECYELVLYRGRSLITYCSPVQITQANTPGVGNFPTEYNHNSYRKRFDDVSIKKITTDNAIHLRDPDGPESLILHLDAMEVLPVGEDEIGPPLSGNMGQWSNCAKW